MRGETLGAREVVTSVTNVPGGTAELNRSIGTHGVAAAISQTGFHRSSKDLPAADLISVGWVAVHQVENASTDFGDGISIGVQFAAKNHLLNVVEGGVTSQSRRSVHHPATAAGTSSGNDWSIDGETVNQLPSDRGIRGKCGSRVRTTQAIQGCNGDVVAISIAEAMHIHIVHDFIEGAGDTAVECTTC